MDLKSPLLGLDGDMVEQGAGKAVHTAAGHGTLRLTKIEKMNRDGSFPASSSSREGFDDGCQTLARKQSRACPLIAFPIWSYHSPTPIFHPCYLLLRALGNLKADRNDHFMRQGEASDHNKYSTITSCSSPSMQYTVQVQCIICQSPQCWDYIFVFVRMAHLTM